MTKIISPTPAKAKEAAVPADMLSREEIAFLRDLPIASTYPVMQRALDAAEAYLGEPARLASARQEGYREGIERAARWHDDQVQPLRLVGAMVLADNHIASATNLRRLAPAPAEASAPVAEGGPAEEPHHGWFWVDDGDVVRWSLERPEQNAPEVEPYPATLAALHDELMTAWELRGEDGVDYAALVEAENEKLREIAAELDDALGEDDDEYPDDTPMTVQYGRTTLYALKLGLFRRARALLQGQGGADA